MELPLPAPMPMPAHGDPRPGADESSKPFEDSPGWDPSALAGRLVEITAGAPAPERTPGVRGPTNIWDVAPTTRDAGSAALTVATSLLWKAQQLGEPSAWINARTSSFFPPDLDAAGIDLAALVVIRTDGPAAAARAADKLLRSGAFGLVILDLGAHAALPSPLVTRLLGLAQKHHAAVVFLTEKSADQSSLAPIVSLRVTASRRRLDDGRFACTVEARKDKRRAPGWTVEETFRGPPGLR